MKEKTKGILIGSISSLILASAIVSGVIVYYNSTFPTYKNEKSIRFCVDDEYKTLKNKDGIKVYPIISDNMIYAPVGSVADIAGIDAKWDGDSNTVYLGLTATSKKAAEAKHNLEDTIDKAKKAGIKYVDAYNESMNNINKNVKLFEDLK